MTERPIGSTFYDPKYGKIQVVEGTDSCRGCIYANMNNRSGDCNILLTGYCHKLFRSDKKNVSFKHIDNDVKLETRPIGSKFMDPHFGLIEVIESDECEGCVYNTDDEMSCLPYSIIAGSCASTGRTDKTSVKFIQCAIKTRPIGSVFTDPMFGKIKVVEGDDCKDCIFYFREDRDEENVGYCKKSINPGYCGPKYRTDGKTVIFKDVDND